VQPILVGNTDNEFGLFKLVAEYAGASLPDAVGSILNLGFTCPAGLAAQGRIGHGVKAWR